MFALEIELLTGRYAATAYNDRERTEWPPHPARLFSALVATWADGDPGTLPGDAELAALRWLEQQVAPVILASASAAERTAAVVFVPVNDVGVIAAPDPGKLEAAERAVAEATTPAARAKAGKQLAAARVKLGADTAKAVAVPTKFGKHDAASAEQVLIDRRTRQPRTFPCATPGAPVFAFAWPEVEAPVETTDALARLAARLVRLGHSSTLVHARVVSARGAIDALAARLRPFVPDPDDGDLMIRWVGPGQVDRLIAAHERHQQVESRVLPVRFVRYRSGPRPAGAPPPRSLFEDDWIVLARVTGPRLPIIATAGLSRQLRRALMSVAAEPIPELLSGHVRTGRASESPHLAIVPLPAVLGRYADGALMGIALVLPRKIRDDDRRALLAAVGELERRGGEVGASPRASGRRTDDRRIMLQLDADEPLILQRVWGEHERQALRPMRWTRASRCWASATPVALDRNPGDLHDPDPATRARAFDVARASVIESVQRIGLPAPVEVDVVRSCVLPGTAKPRSYPRFPGAAHKPQRVLVHIRLVFGERVRGPLLIGAGRYQGLGFCAPIDEQDKEPS